jgi:rubrerythrin
MGYDKKTKKELIDIIYGYAAERIDLIQRIESENRPLRVLERRLKTVEYLFDRSQSQLKSSLEVSDNINKLLDAERFDAEILLKIQDQLITMLGGCVWICPSCGKVAAGKDGPHLIMCTDCIN